MTQTQSEILTAPHVLEYPYKRSLGPVIGRFFTSLRERRIEGVRTASGRVVVPPTEYDPETSDPLSEFVEVGDTGIVTSWAWVTTESPPPAPVRLGAGATGRGRHGDAARGRRENRIRNEHRDARARALGRRAPGRDTRHRVL